MKSMTQFLIEKLQRVADSPERSQPEKDKAGAAIRELEMRGAPVFDDAAFAERFMRNEMDLAFVSEGIFIDLHPAGILMDLIADDAADEEFEARAAKEMVPVLLKHGIDVGHTKGCKVCRAAFEPKWPAPKPAKVVEEDRDAEDAYEDDGIEVQDDQSDDFSQSS